MLEVQDQVAIMLLTEIPQIKEIESEVRLTVLYTDCTRETLVQTQNGDLEAGLAVRRKHLKSRASSCGSVKPVEAAPGLWA